MLQSYLKELICITGQDKSATNGKVTTGDKTEVMDSLSSVC